MTRRWLRAVRARHVESRRTPNWRTAFIRCVHGNVSVELALLAPVLMFIFLGVVEYGRAYTEQLNLGRVARAQLQYAVENLAATSVLDEIDGLSKTLPGGDTVNFAASRSCTCLGAASNCNTFCNGTSFPDMEVQVTAARSLSPLIFFPGHSGPLQISAVSSMRVR
jgi:Flp pilus assembly protein TadG